MDETVALLRSSAIKKRLAGVASLLNLLHGTQQDLSIDFLSTILPDLVRCLRDNNSKIASTALECLELVLQQVPEPTVRSYFKVLWLNLVERLGDSKLQVREKAVDVIVGLVDVLGIDAVFEKLKPCAGHKNWRTREQTLHCIWRCLEKQNLYQSMKNDVLGDIVRMLEDSAKEVRESAMLALEKLYAAIGSSLMYDLESKNIRSGHMKELSDRFAGIKSLTSASVAVPVSSSAVFAASSYAPATSRSAPSSSNGPSSSMAKYLAAIRQQSANGGLALGQDIIFEPSPPKPTPLVSNATERPDIAQNEAPSISSTGNNSISDRDLQRELSKIYDKLQLDNDWSKRVDGLKQLHQLATRCGEQGESQLSALTQGLRSIRERLCEQVGDLRSSVSREACQTIQTLASVLRDEFNPHAEYCMSSLLKATYVTIQVISTASDTCIRGIIASTTSGYTRVINKFIDGARSRNQVLRLNCVSYLTLTLQQWSVSHLSKYADQFVQLMPMFLRDALGDVRAQARKCYWSFHHVFPHEADGVFDRLDSSTQKNLRDDSSRASSLQPNKQISAAISDGATRMPPSRKIASQKSDVASTELSKEPAQRILSEPAHGGDANGSGKPLSTFIGPRRVIESSQGDGDSSERGVVSRVLSQRALRVGLASEETAPATSDRGKSFQQGPLRIRSAEPTPPIKAAVEGILATRVETVPSVGFHSSVQNATAPSKPQRVQLSNEQNVPPVADTSTSASKRLAQADLSQPEASPSEASRKNAVKPIAAPLRQSVKQQPPESPSQEKLNEAINNMTSSSWSTRLEAIECIGGILHRKAEIMDTSSSFGSSKPPNGGKVDGRIMEIFMKHMSDPHYRVAQAVLKNLLPLLKLTGKLQQQQLIPQLKGLLPKLFQKYIDTKESIRAIAKDNLEFILSTVDSSVLIGYVVPLLTDGTNMKVKTVVCHYIGDLLPNADGYIKQGNNYNQMRLLLTKLAQLMDGETPVSVATACGELIQVIAQLYRLEMEQVLPQLPPTKRTVLSRLLKSRGIVVNISSALGSSSSVAESSTTSNASSREEMDVDSNQKMEADAEPVSLNVERSRKRPESPVESPPRNTQKRATTTQIPSKPTQLVMEENKFDGVEAISANMSNAWNSSLDDSLFAHFYGSNTFAGNSSMPSAQGNLQFEDVLDTLTQNNLSEHKCERALQKMLILLKTESSSTSLDTQFSRVLFLLLDMATDQSFPRLSAMKALLKVVKAHPLRTKEFVHPLIVRLLDFLGEKRQVLRSPKEMETDVLVRHIAQLTLSSVASVSDSENVLELLVPFVSTCETPVLQIVCGLVHTILSSCARSPPASVAFLGDPAWMDRLVGPLAQRLSHERSDVRKLAVDCLVAFNYANKHNRNVDLIQYLSKRLDSEKAKLVQIYIRRAGTELESAR